MQPDLDLLSYDENAGVEDAARLERDVVAPINEELTRLLPLRRRG